MIPLMPLRTQNKQVIKLLGVIPVVGYPFGSTPGLLGEQVVLLGGQPARPIKKSANEGRTRKPRPKPPNTSGYRTFSYSKPARNVCAPLVQDTWSAHWVWFEGANDGFRPPPTANAPPMFITG